MVPLETAVTTPPETVAIPEFLLAQDTASLVPLTFSVTFSPTLVVKSVELRARDWAGAVVPPEEGVLRTRATQVAVEVPSVTVMVQFPAEMAVTMPLALTEAMPSSSLLQVYFPVPPVAVSLTDSPALKLKSSEERVIAVPEGMGVCPPPPAALLEPPPSGIVTVPLELPELLEPAPLPSGSGMSGGCGVTSSTCELSGVEELPKPIFSRMESPKKKYTSTQATKIKIIIKTGPTGLGSVCAIRRPPLRRLMWRPSAMASSSSQKGQVR